MNVQESKGNGLKGQELEGSELKGQELKKQYQGFAKYLLILCGLCLVVIGMIGVIVPGLPTTIFLILAAGCFAKSSTCLHSWLLSHKWFGPFIHNWNETRSIPKKAKAMALLMMICACIYSSIMIDTLWLKLTIFAVMLAPAIFVYRLPITKEATDSKFEEKPLKSN